LSERTSVSLLVQMPTFAYSFTLIMKGGEERGGMEMIPTHPRTCVSVKQWEMKAGAFSKKNLSHPDLCYGSNTELLHIKMNSE